MSLNKYPVYLNWLACVFVLVIATPVKAEPADEAKPVDKKPDMAAISQDSSWSDTDELTREEYNIYRTDNPKNPCDRGQDTYNYELSWYDHTQMYVNSRFCEPALWFDNFFATDRVFDEGVAGTYIRWRNDLTIDEEGDHKFKMALSASVELPVLQDRLRLTFDSDEDEDLQDIAPGSSDNSNRLGLQLDLAENIRSKFNVKVSLTPKMRFRYRYTYPFSDKLTLRLIQEVQREKSIHSARSLINVEQLLQDQFLFRSSTEAKVSEEFDGVDWLQAFVLFQRLSKKSSLSYESSVEGITQPIARATNYRLGIRYRKNFHRSWLFYEIAPEMTWPVTYDEQRQQVLQDRRSRVLIFFRLEVHFGNAYKKRYQDYH